MSIMQPKCQQKISNPKMVPESLPSIQCKLVPTEIGYSQNNENTSEY